MEVAEMLENITDCPICLEACKDPKILPCIHTFCLNCLLEIGRKLNKNPSDTLPCPVCRRDFAIPETGFSGLQKNFFMEKLTEMRRMFKPSSSTILCEPCSEERESETDAVIPLAEMYCVNCHQKLCQECCRHHRKNKVSKRHKIIALQDQKINTGDAITVDECEKHINKPLEIYCTKCEKVVCSMCFIENHKFHEGLDVNKVANDVRIQIEESVESWTSFLPQLDQKKKDLDEHDANVNCKVNDIESEICRRREELKELVDNHAEMLLQELQLLKQHQTNTSQTLKANNETLFASLKDYKAYCSFVTKLGSASDLCRAKMVLNTKTKELQQLRTSLDENSFESFHISLKITDLQNYLRLRGPNIIGNLTDFDAQPEEVGTEQTEYKVYPHISTLSAEELKLEAGNEVTDERLRRSKEDASKNLKGTFMHEAEVENLSTTISSLNRELEIQRMHVQDLENERDLLSARIRDSELNEQAMRGRVKDLEDQVTMLTGLVSGGGGGETTKTTGAINWEKNFTLYATVETLCDAGFPNYRMFGIAILGNELFVAGNDSVVVVHDLTTLLFKRRWKLQRMGETIDDIKQCKTNECLYLMKRDSQTFNEIIRFDLKGNEIAAWSVETARGLLSVTRESNVLLTVSNLNQLQEYTPDGKLTNIFQIPFSSGIDYVSHAIKLTSDHFIVCHGNNLSRLSRVCIVTRTGDVVKSFGEPKSFGWLQNPCCMDINEAGDVLILDSILQRALLLSVNLEFKRHHSTTSYFSSAKKILLDESNGRLFTVELRGGIDCVCIYKT